MQHTVAVAAVVLAVVAGGCAAPAGDTAETVTEPATTTGDGRPETDGTPCGVLEFHPVSDPSDVETATVRTYENLTSQRQEQFDEARYEAGGVTGSVNAGSWRDVDLVLEDGQYYRPAVTVC